MGSWGLYVKVRWGWGKGWFQVKGENKLMGEKTLTEQGNILRSEEDVEGVMVVGEEQGADEKEDTEQL